MSFRFLYPFLLAAMLFSTACVRAQVINVTDSLALVDLYNYTNGNGVDKQNELAFSEAGGYLVRYNGDH